MKITLAPFAKPKVVIVALFCAIALTAQASDDKAKQQKQVQEIANKTLQQLYKAQPTAKSAVRHASGYTVFHDMGIKILFAGSGKGKGVAVNNKTKKQVFMKMIELQAGLGVGVERFANVFALKMTSS